MRGGGGLCVYVCVGGECWEGGCGLGVGVGEVGRGKRGWMG